MNKIYKDQYEANEYNFQDIEDTEPDGNIDIHATYTKLPNGYAQILYVHEVTGGNLRNHWLADLANKENTILNISTGVEDKHDFIKRLDRADANVERRTGGKLSEELDNSDDVYVRLMHDLKNHNDQAMRVYIRLLVFAPTKKELKQRVKDIYGEFTQFKFVTLRDFQFSEWRSMWLAALQQFEYLDEHQMGLSMSSSALGGAFWADYQKLEDPYGSILGTTYTGGLVNFNMYTRSSAFRSRPFSMILGSPNFGKSTLQKMLLEDSVMRGNRTVVFDPSNEYGGICDYVGGVTVPLDGRDNMRINPFQIFPTVTDESGMNVDVQASFNQHIEKISSIYSFMSQGLSTDNLAKDKMALNQLLTEFYIFEGMWPRNAAKNLDQAKIFIDVDEYPTLDEFMTYISGEGRKVIANKNTEILISEESMQNITSTFKTMHGAYGAFFNGHTTIPDLSNYPFVRYDIANIMGQTSVFNAMTYSALAMEQPNIINNGKQQRIRRRKGEIDVDHVPHTLIALEEAQNYLTRENAYNLNFIVKLMEQMRKNYAAVIMAMPTIVDVINDNTSATGSLSQEYQRNISKLFDLIQYRFFFNLPENNLASLGKVLGSSITRAELMQISHLPRKKAFLNIQGDQNIYINVTPTREQLQRFNGGD